MLEFIDAYTAGGYAFRAESFCCWHLPQESKALKTTRTRCEVPRQNTQKQDLKSYAQHCRLVMEWVIWKIPFQSNSFFSTHFSEPSNWCFTFFPHCFLSLDASDWSDFLWSVYIRRCLLQSRVMCSELRKRWRELEAWKSDETQPETGDQSQNCIKIHQTIDNSASAGQWK